MNQIKDKLVSSIPMYNIYSDYKTKTDLIYAQIGKLSSIKDSLKVKLNQGGHIKKNHKFYPLKTHEIRDIKNTIKGIDVRITELISLIEKEKKEALISTAATVAAPICDRYLPGSGYVVSETANAVNNYFNKRPVLSGLVHRYVTGWVNDTAYNLITQYIF